MGPPPATAPPPPQFQTLKLPETPALGACPATAPLRPQLLSLSLPHRSVFWGFCFGWKEEAEVFACLALSSFLIPPPFLPLASQDVSSASLAALQPPCSSVAVLSRLGLLWAVAFP